MYRITVEEKLPGGAWKEVKKCEAPGLLCMAMTPEKDRAINMSLGLSARDIARMLIYCDETRAVSRELKGPLIAGILDAMKRRKA